MLFSDLGIWAVSSGVAGFLDLEMYTAECYCGPMPMNPIQHFFITFILPRLNGGKAVFSKKVMEESGEKREGKKKFH